MDFLSGIIGGNLSPQAIFFLKKLHLLFVAFFLGGTYVYVFILHQAVMDFFTQNERLAFLKNIAKRFGPVQLLVLCGIVVSGGLLVTPLKSALGVSYFQAFGSKLIIKLGWFFLIFLLSAYQSMSVGFSVRYQNPTQPYTELTQLIANAKFKLLVTTLIQMILTIWVVYISSR